MDYVKYAMYGTTAFFFIYGAYLFHQPDIPRIDLEKEDEKERERKEKQLTYEKKKKKRVLMPCFPYKNFEECQKENKCYILCNGSRETLKDKNNELIIMNFSTEKDNHMITDEIKDSLSTKMIYKYYEDKDNYKILGNAFSVTNDRFTIDSLCSLYIFVNPQYALQHKELLIEVSKCSTLKKTNNELAIKICFCIERLVQSAYNPKFTKDKLLIFKKKWNDIEKISFLFTKFIQLLDSLFVHENIHQYIDFWGNSFNEFNFTNQLIEDGKILIVDNVESSYSTVIINNNSDDDEDIDVDIDALSFLSIHNACYDDCSNYLIFNLTKQYFEFHSTADSALDFQSDSFLNLVLSLNKLENNSSIEWVPGFDDDQSHQTSPSFYYLKPIYHHNNNNDDTIFKTFLSQEQIQTEFEKFFQSL
eukprot:TRINITY_DN3315_c0_g1_i1.p1 TRINITY_DN3315_c0_g1~~TRINITY_DN3315_c0_g1_i1.p1  ORF type:complete len:418 (+),score=98.52 TRINITY_DN3315_c0_g1_i1:29-1282(+)